MGLKTLEGTKLSLQASLSGASDVSSAGIIKKFALGGFSDSSNGIVNNAFVTPQTYFPGSKNSSLHIQKSQNSNANTQNQESNDGEPQVNNKYSVNSSTPEPLAIFSFTKDDVPALNAAIYQAYFEDRCSMEFSKEIIKKVKQQNEKNLSAILEKVKEETSNAALNLSLIEQYLNSCLDLNRSHNDLQIEMIRALSQEKFNQFEPDKLGLGGRGGNDPISLLSYVGANLAALASKSNTSLMSQLLYLAAAQMRMGATPLILGNNTAYPGRLVSPTRNSQNYIDTDFSSKSQMNLSLLSLASDTNQSFVYPGIESIPYGQKLKLQTLQSGSPIQRIAYLCTLISNEMSISTGLGRLEGTSLGQAFASTGDYAKNFWGAESQNDATVESTSPGCLTDYFVVGKEGSNRLTSEVGIILFDGSKQKSSKNRKNVFDAFVNGSIRSPLSADNNKVQQFSDAQASAIARYDLATQFYKQLHCRDKDANGKLAKLLTPRGLFTRLVSDFVDSLSLFQSKESAKGNQVRELCLLSILGRNSLAGARYGDSSVAVIKRSLLGLMAKKALQVQYGLTAPSPKSGDKETQKSKSNVTRTKVTIQEENRPPSSAVTVSTEDVSDQTLGDTSGEQFNPNPKNPRLCLDEKRLFEKRLLAELTDEVVIGFSELPVDNFSFDPSFAEIDIRVEDFYDDIFTNQNGFLDKLVKIYVDVCDESSKFLEVAGTNSSAVNATRLTKNSQLDGTLILAILMESACLLASDFVNAKISPNSGMQELKENFRSSGIKDDKVKRGWLKLSQTTFLFQAGENTKTALATRSLGALCKASNGNDLTSVFLPKNGNLVIPEVGAVSQNTSISYDSQGQTTIASVVDTLYDLSFERDLPALCLSNVSGMVRYFDSVSQKYKDLASQMLGIKKQTDEVKRLTNFAKSNVGDKFFSSLNDFSLDAAKRKLDVLQQEITSQSGRLPKISLGELRCIQLLLETLSASTHTNNFVVTSFPKDFVTKSLKSTYQVSEDRNNPLKDDTLRVKVSRSSIFSNKTEDSSIDMMYRSLLNRNSFSSFESRVPGDLQDIISNVKIDTGNTGFSFLQKKVDPNTASIVLANELVSYLLRKLFSTLSSADLFADNISDYDFFPVDQNSASTAQIFAQAYGLSLSIFDTVFSSSPDGTKYINEDNLNSLSRLDFDLSTSSVNVLLPPLKFGEAELFYDLFETVYFQPGAIERRIFSIPLFDETVGFLLPPPSPRPDETQVVTVDGYKNATGILDALSKQASKKQVPAFDTYSVLVSASEPLVNK